MSYIITEISCDQNSLLCQCYNIDFYVKSKIIHISQTATDEISHKIDLLMCSVVGTYSEIAEIRMVCL